MLQRFQNSLQHMYPRAYFVVKYYSAIDHMNEVLRHELLRMISWYVGTEKGFNFSLGKNYKFLDKHISKELWDNLLNTYSMSSYEEMWKSFDLCLCLFKKISKKSGRFTWL